MLKLTWYFSSNLQNGIRLIHTNKFLKQQPYGNKVGKNTFVNFSQDSNIIINTEQSKNPKTKKLNLSFTDSPVLTIILPLLNFGKKVYYGNGTPYKINLTKLKRGFLGYKFIYLNPTTSMFHGYIVPFLPIFSGRGLPRHLNAENAERIRQLYDFGYELTVSEGLSLMTDQEMFQLSDLVDRMEPNSISTMALGRFRVRFLKFFERFKKFEILETIPDKAARTKERGNEYPVYWDYLYTANFYRYTSADEFRFSTDLSLLRYMQVRRLLTLSYLMTKRIDRINDLIENHGWTFETLPQNVELQQNGIRIREVYGFYKYVCRLATFQVGQLAMMGDPDARLPVLEYRSQIVGKMLTDPEVTQNERRLVRLAYHRLSRVISGFLNSIHPDMVPTADFPAPFHLFGLQAEVGRDKEYVATIVQNFRKFTAGDKRKQGQGMADNIERQIHDQYTAQDEEVAQVEIVNRIVRISRGENFDLLRQLRQRNRHIFEIKRREALEAQQRAIEAAQGLLPADAGVVPQPPVPVNEPLIGVPRSAAAGRPTPMLAAAAASSEAGSDNDNEYLKEFTPTPAVLHINKAEGMPAVLNPQPFRIAFERRGLAVSSVNSLPKYIHICNSIKRDRLSPSNPFISKNFGADPLMSPYTYPELLQHRFGAKENLEYMTESIRQAFPECTTTTLDVINGRALPIMSNICLNLTLDGLLLPLIGLIATGNLALNPAAGEQSAPAMAAAPPLRPSDIPTQTTLTIQNPATHHISNVNIAQANLLPDITEMPEAPIIYGYSTPDARVYGHKVLSGKHQVPKSEITDGGGLSLDHLIVGSIFLLGCIGLAGGIGWGGTKLYNYMRPPEIPKPITVKIEPVKTIEDNPFGPVLDPVGYKAAHEPSFLPKNKGVKFGEITDFHYFQYTFAKHGTRLTEILEFYPNLNTTFELTEKFHGCLSTIIYPISVFFDGVSFFVIKFLFDKDGETLLALLLIIICATIVTRLLFISTKTIKKPKLTRREILLMKQFNLPADHPLLVRQREYYELTRSVHGQKFLIIFNKSIAGLITQPLVKNFPITLKKFYYHFLYCSRRTFALYFSLGLILIFIYFYFSTNPLLVNHIYKFPYEIGTDRYTGGRTGNIDKNIRNYDIEGAKNSRYGNAFWEDTTNTSPIQHLDFSAFEEKKIPDVFYREFFYRTDRIGKHSQLYFKDGRGWYDHFGILIDERPRYIYRGDAKGMPKFTATEVERQGKKRPKLPRGVKQEFLLDHYTLFRTYPEHYTSDEKNGYDPIFFDWERQETDFSTNIRSAVVKTQNIIASGAVPPTDVEALQQHMFGKLGKNSTGTHLFNACLIIFSIVQIWWHLIFKPEPFPDEFDPDDPNNLLTGPDRLYLSDNQKLAVERDEKLRYAQLMDEALEVGKLKNLPPDSEETFQYFLTASKDAMEQTRKDMVEIHGLPHIQQLDINGKPIPFTKIERGQDVEAIRKLIKAEREAFQELEQTYYVEKGAPYKKKLDKLGNENFIYGIIGFIGAKIHFFRNVPPLIQKKSRYEHIAENFMNEDDKDDLNS